MFFIIKSRVKNSLKDTVLEGFLKLKDFHYIGQEKDYHVFECLFVDMNNIDIRIKINAKNDREIFLQGIGIPQKTYEFSAPNLSRRIIELYSSKLTIYREYSPL